MAERTELDGLIAEARLTLAYSDASASYTRGRLSGLIQAQDTMQSEAHSAPAPLDVPVCPVCGRGLRVLPIDNGVMCGCGDADHPEVCASGALLTDILASYRATSAYRRDHPEETTGA